MFRTVLLLASAVVGAFAACQYEIKNIKFEPCNGPVKQWTLNGIGAEFTDECDVRIKGCVKLNTNLNNVKIDYKAMKNGLEVTRGKKEVCGFQLFDTKFECPLNKDRTICTTKNWVQKLPKGMISMAVGNIKGEAKVTTSDGQFCYKLSADIKKK